MLCYLIVVSDLDMTDVGRGFVLDVNHDNKN